MILIGAGTVFDCNQLGFKISREAMCTKRLRLFQSFPICLLKNVEERVRFASFISTKPKS